MGLEQWYYNPPLPPFHRISPPEDLVRGVLMSDAGRAALTDGVEVYYRHPSPNRDGLFDRFLRGRVVTEGKIIGKPYLSIAARLERGGSSGMNPKAADVIPAEFVDNGVLGPEYVMDINAPASCAGCVAPIDRFSPTGRCADKIACQARRDAAREVELRADWESFLVRIQGSTIWITDADKRAIEWASRKIQSVHPEG